MKKFEIDLELMNNIFMHFINTDINFENKNIFQQILIDNINKGFIYFKHINKINNHYSPSIKNND